MKIAGIGFREAANISSLRSALISAGGTDGVIALATAAEKAEAVALVALAAELHLPIRAITPDALAAVETKTRSERVVARFGTGSLAEAAALAAAGPTARLLGPRAASADGMATAAIAEGDGE
ncbi:cobalamin biosynthesis protein [Afipia sp. GAS231]|uniref:cobalamin biosynthesis protein n=1 Tax=Afipia sp. GAS231 TaxID=1882747 RepID=UPI00087DB103|nr:cobalamin biosynthesis protein [Afipia sp. GAS231]SDP23440.1 cobalt-precorrin 5A hydrolase [Afipia sp. GAS231]